MKKSSIYITDNFISFGQAVLNITSLKKEDIPRALKTLLKENKIITESLILGIPRTQVSVKYLTLPTLKDKEINRMVEYELNSLFPYKPQDLTYDYAVTHKRPDGYSQVMVVAATRELILNQISTLKLAGIVPDVINISTISLFNQFCAQKREAANYLLINFDDAFAEIILITEGKLNFSRGMSLKDITETGNLIKVIEQTITLLGDEGKLISDIILSGSRLDLQDFAKRLKEILPYKVEVDDSFSVLKGLAQKINDGTLNINLLPQELRAQKKKSSRKKTFFLFCALLLLNLSLLANIVFQRIKAMQEYLYLLRAGIQRINPEASQLQEKMFRVQMLKGYINSDRLTLGLLTEIYSAAPEGISLGSLNISHQKSSGTMILSGQAKDSETVFKFVNAIKQSVLLKNVDLNSISQLKSAAPEKIVNFEIRTGF
jgi:Tfp pilus assembly protein PilN